jgi:hypothetical protein
VAGRRPRVDLYAIVGVAPQASRDDIVRAYRRLARSSHPDARPGDPGALARFRMLTDAYDVLSDPTRRAAYDRLLPDSPRGAVTGADRAAASGPTRDAPRFVGDRAWVPDPGAPTAPLWAGPVRVQPPASRRVGLRGPVRSTIGLPEAAALLLRYVDDLWTLR